MAEEKIRHRSYGPPHVDGFRDDEEESVAYCPREKKKKTGKEHRRCEYHDGEEKEKGKDAEAVRCRYDDEEDPEDADDSPKNRP